MPEMPLVYARLTRQGWVVQNVHQGPVLMQPHLIFRESTGLPVIAFLAGNRAQLYYAIIDCLDEPPGGVGNTLEAKPVPSGARFFWADVPDGSRYVLYRSDVPNPDDWLLAETAAQSASGVLGIEDYPGSQPISYYRVVPFNQCDEAGLP